MKYMSYKKLVRLSKKYDFPIAIIQEILVRNKYIWLKVNAVLLYFLRSSPWALGLYLSRLQMPQILATMPSDFDGDPIFPDDTGLFRKREIIKININHDGSITKTIAYEELVSRYSRLPIRFNNTSHNMLYDYKLKDNYISDNIAMLRGNISNENTKSSNMPILIESGLGNIDKMTISAMQCMTHAINLGIEEVEELK